MLAGKPSGGKSMRSLLAVAAPSPKAVRLLFLGAVLALTAITWGIHHLASAAIETNVTRNLAQRIGSEAVMLENHVARSLDGVITVLHSASVMEDRGLTGTPDQTTRLLVRMIGDTPAIRSLSLIDESGRVVASSTARNVGIQLPRLALASPEDTLESGEIGFGGVFSLRDLHELNSAREPVDLGFWTAMRADEIDGRRYRWLAAINLGVLHNLWSELDTDEATEIHLLDALGQRIASHHENDPSRTARAIDAMLREPPLAPRGSLQLDADNTLVAFQRSAAYPTVVMMIGDPALVRSAASGPFSRLNLVFIGINVFLLTVMVALFLFYRQYEARTTELVNYVKAIDLHVMVSKSDRKGLIHGGNRAFFESNGYSPEELVGQHYSKLSTEFHTPEARVAAWAQLGRGEPWKGTLRNSKKTGEDYWVSVTIVPFPDVWGRANYFISLMTDVTETIELAAAVSQERRLREELSNLNQQLATTANTDPLTGLPNRRAFDLFMDQAQTISAEDGRPLSLLLLDIDHFKQINDTYGHHAGDEVLATLARRWQRELRKSDMVARIGGEEFCVVLPRTPAAHAVRIAEKLRNITAALPVELDPDSERSREISVTVSIGVGTAPEPSRVAPAALMMITDEAVYAAKAAGRNRTESRLAE